MFFPECPLFRGKNEKCVAKSVLDQDECSLSGNIRTRVPTRSMTYVEVKQKVGESVSSEH